MKKYVNKIIQGDCLKIMKTIEDNSIDTIITDPPYGLKFMGKKWDYNVPSIEIWKECLRVLKPGGTALIFAGSRTQHRMAVNVEDAGFILKDCMMWIYGSGFPKSTDISKQLDKGVERKVVGKQKTNTKMQGGNYGGEKEDKIGGIVDITEPATPKAKLWNGYGTALKPAYEPILVAMKPNEGTYANNALKWGVSGLNIDGGRIGFRNKADEKESKGKNQHSKYPKSVVRNAAKNGIYHQDLRPPEDYVAKGRFPANIIHDGSDEVVGLFPDTETHAGGKSTFGGVFGNGEQTKTICAKKSERGSASRFFYCAKSSKSERNFGCEELPVKQTIGGGGTNNTPDDVCGKYGSIKAKAYNHHPTVKPLKLMEYLCTITKTPTGGIVLDPFAGSGTTCIAAKKTGRDFIGIEKDKSYCEIANKRIKAIPLKLFN